MTSRRFAAALALVVVASIARPSPAAATPIVYQQAVNVSAGDTGYYSFINQQTATEFVLSAGDIVGSASWYGTEWDAGDGFLHQFTINIYADSGNGFLPGALVASRSVTASYAETGAVVQGERMALFSASFTDIALSANQGYWLSIVNGGNTARFRWTESTGGMDSAATNTSMNWFALPQNDNRTPMNFTLYEAAAPVPEPASLVLLGTGLAGVAARLRRRAKK